MSTPHSHRLSSSIKLNTLQINTFTSSSQSPCHNFYLIYDLSVTHRIAHTLMRIILRYILYHLLPSWLILQCVPNHTIDQTVSCIMFSFLPCYLCAFEHQGGVTTLHKVECNYNGFKILTE